MFYLQIYQIPSREYWPYIYVHVGENAVKANSIRMPSAGIVPDTPLLVPCAEEGMSMMNREQRNNVKIELWPKQTFYLQVKFKF